jgi:hypothetical protein
MYTKKHQKNFFSKSFQPQQSFTGINFSTSANLDLPNCLSNLLQVRVLASKSIAHQKGATGSRDRVKNSRCTSICTDPSKKLYCSIAPQFFRTYFLVTTEAGHLSAQSSKDHPLASLTPPVKVFLPAHPNLLGVDLFV